MRSVVTLKSVIPMHKYNVSYVYDQAVLVVTVDADNELDAQLLASNIHRATIPQADGSPTLEDILIEKEFTYA